VIGNTQRPEKEGLTTGFKYLTIKGASGAGEREKHQFGFCKHESLSSVDSWLSDHQVHGQQTKTGRQQ